MSVSTEALADAKEKGELAAMVMRRDRLVSFRLSEEEYQCLRNVSIAQKARSISEFARTLLGSVIFDSMQPDEFANDRKTMELTLTHLTHTMRELSRAIAHVTDQIDKARQQEEQQLQKKELPAIASRGAYPHGSIKQ